MSALDEGLDAQLTDYLEGTLPEDVRRALEARLESDPEVAQALEDARQARALLGGLTPRPIPTDFAHNARRRLRKRTNLRASRGRGRLLGSRLSVEAFAVLVLALMLMLYLYFEDFRSPAPAPGRVDAGAVPGPKP